MPVLHRFVRGMLALSATTVIAACVTHDPEPAFRASVWIGDRGISIPLPPPSLHAEPKQEVEVQGEIVGLDDVPDGLSVHIVDQASGSEVEVALMAGSTEFTASGLSIDLTDNCLELWIEDLEGNDGQHQEYRATIDDTAQAVVVVEGCP